jgi:hypothetical protein
LIVRSRGRLEPLVEDIFNYKPFKTLEVVVGTPFACNY